VAVRHGRRNERAIAHGAASDHGRKATTVATRKSSVGTDAWPSGKWRSCRYLRTWPSTTVYQTNP